MILQNLFKCFQTDLFLIGRMVKLSGLEMIIKVSDYFKISIDELLKNDVQTVKKIDK